MKFTALQINTTLKTLKGEVLLSGLKFVRLLSSLVHYENIYYGLVKRLILRTGLFDSSYYLSFNPDVQDSSYDAIEHYIKWGDSEFRSPTLLFDPQYYRIHASKFDKSVNTLLHYSLIGRFKNFSPSPWFDVDYYLRNNRDVARALKEPLFHYLKYGGFEGRSPNPQFDGYYYITTYPDVIEAGINPLVHYIKFGRAEGRITRLPIKDICDDEIYLPSQADLEIEIPKLNWDEFEFISFNKHELCDVQTDVIVPVYKNRALTLRCLLSILNAKTNAKFELIVINDAGPEPELLADLRKMADRNWITLLENDKNLGFVLTVNKGLALNPSRDVVLLNSDTEVYDGWLDKLKRAAYSSGNTASVTPLSNNATICSYPRFLHDNPYPLDIEYSELDRLTSEVNTSFYVEAPTGVGFCMYMRRDAILEVGMFDAESFGKGYGEENDWCQRAKKLGWRNIVTADTFVRHFGSASFEGERFKRIEHALHVLDQKHPSYDNQVREFIQLDPLKHARERLDWTRLLQKRRQQNVLMICHERGGGTERHFQEDAKQFLLSGKGVYFLRPCRLNRGYVRLQHPFVKQLLNTQPIKFSETEALAQVLTELKITEIHSHGLVDFEASAPEYLQLLCRTIGVPLSVDIHDYKVICPRINLAKPDGHYCGEPDDKGCNSCLKLNDSDYFVYDIQSWREMHEGLLSFADQVIVPDIDVAKRLGKYYPKIKFKVEPHEQLEFKPAIRKYKESEIIRVAIIGAISKIKGFDVLLECAKHAKKRKLPIEFSLVGYSANDAALLRAGVRVTGKYQEAEVMRLLNAVEPHITFLPALWPETYSYTLSIALELGCPIMAFDIGAAGTRLRAVNWSHGLIPLEWSVDPKKINEKIISLSGS